ncbi:MAG TPA: MerR family transcriptional regulator [Crenotrichaceae bacterium]|nr:MerR family transcriptional regulator [Crenotrichaceae bacterium]
MENEDRVFSGVVMDDHHAVSLAELCRSCSLPAEQIVTMIEHGIIEPIESHITITRWQFTGDCLLRVKTAVRLQHDLGVNLAGAALALELLDEVRSLRYQVASLQRN